MVGLEALFYFNLMLGDKGDGCGGGRGVGGRLTYRDERWALDCRRYRSGQFTVTAWGGSRGRELLFHCLDQVATNDA